MTTAFALDWLTLRERYDRDARSVEPMGPLAAWLAGRQVGRPLEVIDLGCGSGANLRLLAPLLADPALAGIALAEQHWRLVDRDPTLLAIAAAEPLGVRRTAVRSDLAAELESLPLAAAHLVTASALLDLVSTAWIDRLAQAVTASFSSRRAPALLFALNYDGRTVWGPAHRRDAEVLARFNAHQRGDKGFGPAAGAEAADHLIRALQTRGYRVFRADTPWRLQPGARAIQTALVDGTVEALAGADPAAAGWLQDWRSMRLGCIRAGRATTMVGHVDVLALPGPGG